MKLKTYRGESIQQALNKAKAELGEDVVILETKYEHDNKLSSNGASKVILTTTYLPQSQESNNIAVTGKLSDSIEKKSKRFYEYLQENVKKDNSSHHLNQELGKELSFLRQEMANLNRHFDNFKNINFPEPFLSVLNKLIKTGVSTASATKIICRILLKLGGQEDLTEDTILGYVKSEIISIFTSSQSNTNRPKSKRQIITVLGSTGVGKTTSLIKLALNPEFSKGKNIAIISTDTYRMGALSQLTSFSNLTSIPIIIVSNPDQLKSEIKKLRKADIILIDTPGRSPMVQDFIQEQKNYLDAVDSTERYVVLSLTADFDDLCFNAGVFSPLQPTGVIFSKIDETTKPGKMVSIKDELGLPINYICDGQSIPNNIQVCTGEYVWEKIKQVM